MMTMMAASLLICAVPYAAKADKLEAAKTAEQKGNLARLHKS
jgi:hypothetical protein